MGFKDFFNLLNTQKNIESGQYELEFQTDWDMRCDMMDILDKKGYKLPCRKGKRDITIVDFSSIEELNDFLSEFNLVAKEVKGSQRAVNPNTMEVFCFIKISFIRGKKSEFNKNLINATIALYKQKHLVVFYAS